uniref:Uncharacterized protein n=1 Tax=Sphaerodactylus townsendi TaxID=933632 RepID=A0ACB8EXI0_9SAUR
MGPLMSLLSSLGRIVNVAAGDWLCSILPDVNFVLFALNPNSLNMLKYILCSVSSLILGAVEGYMAKYYSTTGGPPPNCLDYPLVSTCTVGPNAVVTRVMICLLLCGPCSHFEKRGLK